MEVKVESVEKELIKENQNKIKESLLKAIAVSEYSKIINLNNSQLKE